MLEASELRKLSANLQANPDNYMDSFRENVRMYIDQKEITLAEVSELADMPESTLKTFIYNGGKDCMLSTAVKLARVFNISIDELVGAGTISPQTCESLQTMRQLPVSFTHFVRYATHLHYQKLTSGEITEKAIEIMNPELDVTGSMVMTNCFEILDISDINEDARTKSFMGIRLPGDMYVPKFFPGDILLISNDRNPRENEYVVANLGENIFLFQVKYEMENGEKKQAFYSVRDGKKRAFEDQVKMILGYVIKVIHEGE